ncbi:PREDICTED: uncharacterized protein LOC100637688 isoform X1 [Amphimedon queenslandica]|uniref:Ig-like domain-containing protein n=2 Tax=Amphimedon queenslandica TaxID=400682 RepID=A0AAN0JRW6_AMPQE|nr:PREDICTED: uncharacterized protein LOC100637688 isoform X1 [Amphimedon queenslandica]|eukprot:XP_019859830.1 PREDICTED: uncharacterized protein LOC100637688 isoform X1 [Amphimedon queenslandica]
MSVFLHLLLLVPSVAGVSLSLTSGEVCEGAVATWTCVVNNSYDGVSVAWRNNGEIAYPLNTLAPLGPDSPFNATLTSINSSTIISIATATVTDIVNGSLLECSDSRFNSPSTNVTLILKHPEAANLSSPVFHDDGIRVSWSGATCLSSLSLSVHLSSVYEVDVKNVAGTTHYDFIPVTSGEYSFGLTSVDYSGNDIGSMNSTSIPWKEPKISVDTNVNNNIANFTIRNNDDERPPVTNCSITFDDVLKSCVMNNIVIFSITPGAKHSYNITVTNAAGTVNMNGELSNEVYNTTMELSASVDPLAVAASPTVLGVLIILSVCWILLRICWKRQWCCPRVWRSSFWLLFFCYDCCTYDAGVIFYTVKGKTTAINAGLENTTVGGEKGPDTTL